MRKIIHFVHVSPDGNIEGPELIDEHYLVVHPVVLGGGTPLFTGAEERLDLQLVDSRAFDSQSVLLRYRL